MVTINKAVIISEDEVFIKQRPLRFYLWLKDQGWDISIINSSRYRSSNLILLFLQRIMRGFLKIFRFHEAAYWDRRRRENQREIIESGATLVICCDITSLPLASAADRDYNIIMDARDYYPDQFSCSVLWRILQGPYFKYLSRQYLPICDKAYTVSDAHKRRYQSCFQVEMSVMPSYSNYLGIHSKLSLHDPIRLVHHGACKKVRQLERMIEIVKLMGDKFYFDLYLTNDEPRYLRKIKRIASSLGNIRVFDLVPGTKIHNKLTEYDIGLYIIPPVTFNLNYSLPNKVFEFIQAGIAVVSGPSPSVAKVIDDYNCGCVLESFDSRASADFLSNLSGDKISDWKRKSQDCSRYVNEDVNKEIFLKDVESLLSNERP